MAADSRPKSLRDVILKHTSFLVNPLQWTSRHLDLVGCRFEDVTPSPSHVPPSERSDPRDNGAREIGSDAPGNAASLATNPFPIKKRRSLINILVNEKRVFACPRKGPPFHFQGRPVHQPDYIVFPRRENNIDHIHTSSSPLVGYLHYTSVNGDRRRLFEPCPGPMGALNAVGANVCQKLLHRIIPKEWTEDPYLICLLLALAQSQERKSGFSSQIVFTSCILVTNVLDREHLLFYEADVTTEVLDGLKNPRDSARPIQWPRVRRKAIPYQPYNTFSSRLLAELMVSDPLQSYLINSRPKVNGVMERGRKRRREREENGSHKTRRISSTG
ncbi:hypothetical protein N7526_011423 [Penicillium atrosanguineum]|nr:hypothetical protein N7526_011423 [Penicillium atrosanguineum]